MANTQTDQLGLATTSTITGGFLFFGPTVKLDTGFSLEVFRKSGEYLGSVASREGSDASQAVRRLGAHDGDQVVRVNLGEHPLTITGSLATSDGYIRTYEATVFIRASNAPAFAIAYRQGADPVAQARVAIDAELVRWAEWMEHDAITPVASRFRAGLGLNTIKRSIGLSIARVERVTLTEDAKRAAVREAMQQAMVDQAVIQTTEQTARVRITEQDVTAQQQHIVDVRIQDEERDRIRADHHLKLELEEQQAQHQLRASVREQLTTTIVEEHQKRLRELLDAGYTQRQISEEEPDLMRGVSDLFSTTNADALAPTTNIRQLPEGTPTSGDASANADASTQAGTVRQPLEADEIYNPQLGLAIMQHQLSPERMQWAGAPSPIAFLVVRLDSEGPAQQGGLQVSDLLFLIDQHPISTPVELTSLIKEASLRDGTVHMAVLRGDKVMELPVYIG